MAEGVALKTDSLAEAVAKTAAGGAGGACTSGGPTGARAAMLLAGGGAMAGAGGMTAGARSGASTENDCPELLWDFQGIVKVSGEDPSQTPWVLGRSIQKRCSMRFRHGCCCVLSRRVGSNPRRRSRRR